MWWGGYYSYPSTGSDYILKVYEYYSSSEYDYIKGNNYNSFTYTFKIKRETLFNYIFLSIPTFVGDYVLIECTSSSSGLSVVAIVFIIIGCVAIFIILISCIIIRKRRNASYNSPELTINKPTYTPPAQQLYEPVQPVVQPVVQPIYNTVSPGYNPVQPVYMPPTQPMDIPPAQPTYMPNYPSN